MIHGYTENIEEKKSRNLLAKKLKEKYQRACQSKGTYPLTAVLDQFDNDHVNLAEQRLGPEHWKILAIVILKNEIITGLDLRNNCLGSDGAFTVADFIRINRTLTHLNVADNLIGLSGLRDITSAITDNILITKLDISGNEITDEGAKLVATMIEARTGLRELRMNHNCIREDGALAIGKALEENVYLLYLDLSWNHIRCKGAVAIANCLKSNVCLQKLDLAWNGFGKEGAQAMGQALAENSTLKELDLTNNRINANGMALLMAGLKYNETLEVLKIGQNPFNSDVAKHLLMILEQAEKSALILVEMSDVSVDEDFMAVLERLAAKSHLNVKHGKFTRKVPVKEFRPPKPPPRDPITMIYDYKYERGYRTLDLLMQLDKDNNFIIDRQEFTDGLALMGIEVAEEDIDDLMGKLDHNADGRIDYRELVEGEKEYGHREGRNMQMSTIMKIRELAKTMMQFKFKEVVDAAKNKPDGVAAQTEHAPSAGNGAGASVNAGAVKTSGSGTRAAVKK